jgi:hypothetical protein
VSDFPDGICVACKHAVWLHRGRGCGVPMCCCRVAAPPAPCPACATNQAEREKAERWADLVARGKSPCGHWKAYAVTEDGGKHIDCLRCLINHLEAACATKDAEIARLVQLHERDTEIIAIDVAFLRRLTTAMKGEHWEGWIQPEDITALRSEQHAAEAECLRLRATIAADEARLRAAEARVWPEGLTFGCDAAEHLADEVLSLRDQLAALASQETT